MSKFNALRTFKAESEREAPGRPQQAAAQATLQQPAQAVIQPDDPAAVRADGPLPPHTAAQAYERQYGQALAPRVRPIGKRSDPDFKMFSHLLRKSTQRKAQMKLLRLDDGRDMSEILEVLLSDWADKPDDQS